MAYRGGIPSKASKTRCLSRRMVPRACENARAGNKTTDSPLTRIDFQAARLLVAAYRRGRGELPFLRLFEKTEGHHPGEESNDIVLIHDPFTHSVPMLTGASVETNVARYL
jgi:hypothetical protein